MQGKSLLILISHAPQASSNNQEAIDLALAAASFDQDVSLLFTGNGLFQLVSEQSPNDVGRKNLPKMLKALPIYGIRCFAEQNTLLDASQIADTTVLSKAQVKQLINEHDTVLHF